MSASDNSTVTSRKILVTSALPYANGALHLGHLVEQIQTDIWVRLQKMHGHSCFYVCGDDAHGTPIMLSAEKKGVSPETLIAETHEEHLRDSNDFLVEFDAYHTTHSPENRVLAETIYRRLHTNGDITKHTIRQAYDPIKHIFLPDRFVKGECPRCGAADQYGDNCEACGATYTPTELKNPVSVISGATPIQKDSEHYFFELKHYENQLKEWTQSGRLQEQIANKLSEWFHDGLKAWDISRDAPYFGFEIPDAPGKYFYVWLDAPIGYMAAFQSLCQIHPELDFNTFWNQESTTELYHFVGKDIIYFHALFWPAMLSGANYRTPTAIFSHGFLTVDGQKMSKSRGTFLNARTYLDHLDPEYLRYYFAAKLNSRIDDLDLNFDDFVQRVNADLIGKFINIASRCAGFITQHFDGQLSINCEAPELLNDFIHAGDSIAEAFESREYSRAIREIMALADRANQYINDKKPWALIKIDAEKNTAHAVCSMGINLFRILSLYLQPVLPKTAKKVAAFLNIPPMSWADRHHPLYQHRIEVFQPLLQRIESSQIAAMKQASIAHR